jgi:hypothetical protein
MTDVPAPLKALVGLVAAVIDRLPEPRELPEKAVELPVLAVGAVLQASLRAQQLYAELTVRGDEAISQLRGAPDQPPAWASFDDAPDNVHDDAPVTADSDAPDSDAPESDAQESDAQDDDAPELVIGAADEALLVPQSPAGQYTAPIGATGQYGPSAFDLANDRDDDGEPVLGD